MSLAVLWQPASAASVCRVDWPLWNFLTSHYLSEDGRIVDQTVPAQHSTSESQSYGMFFALVANDRARFDKIWRWSLDNLLGGRLSDSLPAWQWGKRDDGNWGVIDPNAASDGNLWFAYSLLEAGRLWSQPRYIEQGLKMAKLVAAQEWVDLPGFGLQLLPGPSGFYNEETQTWRLNPSYITLPQLRLLAVRDPEHDWNRLAERSVALMRAVTPRGLAPNWVGYRLTSDASGEFLPDPVHGDVGSYDAIRTYLWAGVTSPGDPLARPLRDTLFGMTSLVRQSGQVPEMVYTLSGATSGVGPPGFAAAMLPLWTLTGQSDLVSVALQHLSITFNRPVIPASGDFPAYYDLMLALFGLGWYEQQYRFAADGSLLTRWEKSC